MVGKKKKVYIYKNKKRHGANLKDVILRNFFSQIHHSLFYKFFTIMFFKNEQYNYEWKIFNYMLWSPIILIITNNSYDINFNINISLKWKLNIRNIAQIVGSSQVTYTVYLKQTKRKKWKRDKNCRIKTIKGEIQKLQRVVSILEVLKIFSFP